MSSITFSSCFYLIKSKYPTTEYIKWIQNFIYIANCFNLVIYTDLNSLKYINTLQKPNIKIIIKPMNEFYCYQYKDNWIKNHDKNQCNLGNTCWELNMIWNEKIALVKETIERNYFETDMYGWCDIGYFRNRPNDLQLNVLSTWANQQAIQKLDNSKIHYGCVNNDIFEIAQMIRQINHTNLTGLPKTPISPKQTSIAGGFFILHKQYIQWWFETYYSKLFNYFKHGYLVKDDQMIVANCIFTAENTHRFSLFVEKLQFDNWFMFQRILK
jgi:hypothetical protein